MAAADEYVRGRAGGWLRFLRGGTKRAGSGDQVIDLSRDTAFACGYHRDCFVHPDNADCCIKISRRDDHRETIREAQYYTHLERRDVSWTRLPRFHGFVETTLGSGAVFDLVRDGDGGISKPLVYYLESPELTARHRQGLVRSLAALRDYLLDERIVVRTLKAKNLVYQVASPEGGRLYIVDNIGNTEALPLATHVPYFALKKIGRKWARFEQDLNAEYPDNPLIGGIIDEVRCIGREFQE